MFLHNYTVICKNTSADRNPPYSSDLVGWWSESKTESFGQQLESNLPDVHVFGEKAASWNGTQSLLAMRCLFGQRVCGGAAPSENG